MRLVVFGLTVSSSWGNAHAPQWRALSRALGRAGHRVVFFERDLPCYARHRDLERLEGGEVRLYESWPSVLPDAKRALAAADVAVVTSYCPDGVAAAELVFASRARCHAFYDLDAPVTLALARVGQRPEYLGPGGLRRFDLVLSDAGGPALDELQALLGARRVAPLYGCVDPELHRPAPRRGVDSPRAELSHLGTWAPDRRRALELLLFDAARALPDRRFLVAGALYPPDVAWPANVARAPHVAPADHASFHASSRLTLELTRAASSGYCPSGRLFEAAACGAAIVGDAFEGLDRFFAPGHEILVARGTDDVLAAIGLSDEELARIGRAARERALAEHTAERRADELLAAVEAAGR